MEDVPYELIYAGQVREIQGAYPKAHQAMVNWGRWSRRLQIKPFLCRPALWNMVQADREEWGDEQPEDEQPQRKRSEPLQDVGKDPSEEPKADERLGHAIDVLIHSPEFTAAAAIQDPDFPSVWRVTLKAAYYTRALPEYQMPREADQSYDSFLMFLDGALQRIQGVLDGKVDHTA